MTPFKRASWNEKSTIAKPNAILNEFNYGISIYISLYNLLFDIRINKPNELPCPIYFHKQFDKRVVLKYKKNNFDVKDFVNYIFDIMYKSYDNIMHEQYKDLINLFYGFNCNENDCDMCDEYINRNKCDEISIMATNRHFYGYNRMSLDLYEMNDIITFPKTHYDTHKCDLFMVKNKPFAIESSTHKKLIIKFVSEYDQKLNTLDYH